MLMMYIKAFIVGGVLCAIGQVLILKTQLTSSRILVGYVTTGVILGALGIYKPLVDFAGAGATVPLLGTGGEPAAARRAGRGWWRDPSARTVVRTSVAVALVLAGHFAAATFTAVLQGGRTFGFAARSLLD